ncbi:hypothetical protein [Nonomuraea maheshkhaliensis]|uniref:MmyB family transcriptional regulator n=1 Tax=Nonomuraea maheshkhaliensis TaxID=419590 RepID=UPI003D156AB9
MGGPGGTAGALSLKSERFRRLWARHDVRAARPGVFSIRRPRAGDLEMLGERPPA